MWKIFEHRSLQARLGLLPKEILKRYEKWKDIVTISGPSGLRLIKGLHDEALRGKWIGFRSSRLGLQYRIIYKIADDKMQVLIKDITAHDYKRK